MKKLLAIILILWCGASYGQKLDYNSSYGVEYRRVAVDSLFATPNDTFPVPDRYKTLQWFAMKNRVLYAWHTSNFYWTAVSSGGGGTDNSKVGSGFTILKPATQEIKTIFPYNRYISIDSITNANALTFRALGATEQTPMIGVLVNQNNWTSTTGYTLNGSSASASGGKLVINTNTDGTNFESVDLDAAVTVSEATHSYLRFKTISSPGGTSYGISLGRRSVNTTIKSDMYFYVDLSSGGDKKLRLVNTYPSGQVLATSTDALTITAGTDKISITVDRMGDVFVGTARNETTNSAPIKIIYSYSTTYASPTPNIPNTSKHAIFAIGGDGYEVDSLFVIDYNIKYSDFAFIGDSKLVGYFSNYSNRTATLFKQYYPNTTVYAGGGDKSVDALARTAEIIAAHPKYAIIDLGTNDPDTATTKTNVASIVSTLEAAGIACYHMVFYQSNNAWRQAWLERTYTGRVINVREPTSQTGALSADNLHPSDRGDSLAAQALIDANLFVGFAVKRQDGDITISGGSGISSLNGLTGGTQTFDYGTSGASTAWTSSGTTHTLNIPVMAGSGVSSGLINNTTQTIPGAKTWSDNAQFNGKMFIPTNSTTDFQYRVGTLFGQSYGTNNGSFGDNSYFNGSAWTRVATGYTFVNQYYNGQELKFGAASGSGTYTESASYKLDYTGKMGLGTNISLTAGDFTGATLLFDPVNTRIGIGTVSPLNTLDVNGTVRIRSLTGAAASSIDSTVVVEDGILKTVELRITSGVWTPTITGGANFSSSSSPSGHYIRIGNEVSWSVFVTVTPTAGSAAVLFGVSLPIASAMTTQLDAIGTGIASTTTASGETVRVLADDTNDRLAVSVDVVSSTTARNVHITGHYTVK